MNTEVMFSSKSAEWETPQDLFDKLNEEFHFTLDVCATPENTKCEHYYTSEQDGLSQPWKGVIWCNPPYGKSIGSWVRRGLLAAADGKLWLCCCPRVLIRDGFTSTYTTKQRCASLRDGSSSAETKMQRRFHQ